MKKRIISLVLTFVMLFSCFSPIYAAAAFADVKDTKYESAVESLQILGIVSGYEDNTYKPEKFITRAELAKLLVVASGKEEAANFAKGKTNFVDIKENHWATGFINVASQYDYIKGYPDGSFKPNKVVSYAEAVTMAIRVIGYQSVVDSKGVWPTNYISKAQELRLLEDIKYTNYNNGATRGDIALLIWNLLSTQMWDVISESEGDGLNYGAKDTLMELYFDNYIYCKEAQVTGIDVEDGKVYLTLSDIYNANITWELKKDTDFLNLLGRTVDVLYNKEIEKIVMLTVSDEDKIAAGRRDELIENKYNFSAVETSEDYLEIVWGKKETSGDYTVNVIKNKKNVKYSTRYATSDSTAVVDKIKVYNDNTKINTNKLTIRNNDALILIDKEWKTVEDIKVGDIITELVKDELYAVSRKIVAGEFEKLTREVYNDDERYYMTVDGEKYNILDFVTEVVELDENNEEKYTETLENILKDKNSKYYNETVTLYVNFLNEVIKVEFEEVNEKAIENEFYVMTNVPASWEEKGNKGKVTTYIELNGEKYVVKTGVEVPVENKSGDVVYVEFDDKDRVTAVYNLLASGDKISGDYIVDIASNKNGIYEEKNREISGDKNIYKVTSNTKVVKITGIKDNDDIVTSYEVDILGRDALKGVEYGLIVSEYNDSFNRATYVFVWEETKDKDTYYSLVTGYSKINGIEYLEINGELLEVSESVNNVEDYNNKLVGYSYEDEAIVIKYSGDANEYVDALKITEVIDDAIEVSGDIIIDFENLKDDVVFLVAEVGENDIEEYEFYDLTVYNKDNVKLRKNDRIVDVNNDKVILVLREM